ncbi:MAG: Gfo/Idh/MocA family oxidoreductase [Bryobacteraceae bacterium]|nr:Gfo/Idh/MocA family oxidoreductase [Bryobacteraceae bacterium]
MDSFSRRQFLGAAGVVVATARSYAQVSGSNERIRIGVIGCGGMAGGHMRTLVRNRETDNIEIIAVCDVYDKRAQQAAQLTGGKIYKDYRTLLENKDIDYVLIATPEHWHYQMAVDALDAGKHVYVEKPMTQHSEQAKKLAAKVRDGRLKLQVGVQGMSDDSYEKAYEYVKDGTLGKVVLAQIDYSRNHKDDYWAYPIDPDARPGENLDWKAWLGPAPKRPFDPNRYFRWRWFWDYSGGIASDLFVHRVTRIIKALNLTFPEKGVATGGKFQFTESAAEVPDTFNVLLDYPGGPTVQLISSMANDTPVDHLLRGHKATLQFTSTGFVIRPQRLFADSVKEVEFKKTGAESIELHHRNLQNAIRRNEPLKCDATLGYYGVVAAEMGVLSYRKRAYMLWDQKKERIVRA